MNGQFKKFFSIILALLLGAGIILLAWKGSSFFGSPASTQKTSDAWVDALRVIPRESPSNTLGAGNIYKGSTDSASVRGTATTTTDILARNLIIDYAIAQGGMSTTTWSDADADALAQSLIEKIDLPRAKQYTLQDLNISSDNSITSFAAYGATVDKIMQPFFSPQKIGEGAIIADALSSKDETKLKALTPIIAEYAQMKTSLLALKTPSGIAPLHLRFVQSFANIESAVASMQKIIVDPAQGLVGFMQYKKEITALDEIGKEYQNYTPSQ